MKVLITVDGSPIDEVANPPWPPESESPGDYDRRNAGNVRRSVEANMVWQLTPGMDDYLKATDLSDSDNPVLRDKAIAIIQGAGTPRQAAKRIFFFVRDQILFGFNRHDARASNTLKEGVGFCVTKTNLQVALLRAAGIPARYHQAVLSTEALRAVLPNLVYRFVPERTSYHPWCECYVAENWISCDTLFDKGLYDALLRRRLISREQIPNIDWDGIHDLNTATAWILEDAGTAPCLDEVFKKAQTEQPPELISVVVRRLCNRHIEKLRKG